MRELRFRVWVVEQQEMSKPFGFDDLQAGCWWQGDPDEEHIVTIPDDIGIGFDTLWFMEWTGINDKHGHPIFEGDIIYQEGKGEYEVRWSKMACAYMLVNPEEEADQRWLKQGYQDEYEIWRNTYEVQDRWHR